MHEARRESRIGRVFILLLLLLLYLLIVRLYSSATLNSSFVGLISVCNKLVHCAEHALLRKSWRFFLNCTETITKELYTSFSFRKTFKNSILLCICKDRLPCMLCSLASESRFLSTYALLPQQTTFFLIYNCSSALYYTSILNCFPATKEKSWMCTRTFTNNIMILDFLTRIYVNRIKNSVSGSGKTLSLTLLSQKPQ